jgi:hypothetical protein
MMQKKSKFIFGSPAILFFVGFFCLVSIITEYDSWAFDRYGRAARRLPSGHRELRFRGHHYFYHHGTFYRRGPSGFWAVRGPIGAIVVGLPIGFRTVFFGGLPYYYYGGIYYRSVPSGYMVVEPPAGAVTASFSAGFRRLYVNGNEYFYKDGVFYIREASEYVVVTAPVGAVIPVLPTGYGTMFFQGVKYLYYDDVYYQEVPSGYVVVEPPAGAVAAQEESAANQTPVPSQPPAETQLPAASSGKVTVTSPLLNVRSGPGMNFATVTQVRQGTVLEVHGNAPGWLYVRIPSGKFGWVAQQFTTAEETPASG